MEKILEKIDRWTLGVFFGKCLVKLFLRVTRARLDCCKKGQYLKALWNTPFGISCVVTQCIKNRAHIGTQWLKFYLESP